MDNNEDFASMLEDYMDPEEIREILEEDEREEREEKEASNSKVSHSSEAKFPEEITISIKDYVERFLDIPFTPKVVKYEEKKWKKGKKKPKSKKQKVVESRKITIDYNTLWHKGLKEIGSPFVFGVANDYAYKNPDKVYDGELLLVIDAKGHLGTYVNPNFIRQLIDTEDIETELKKLRKTGVQQLEYLEEYIQEVKDLQIKCDILAAKNKKLLQLLSETRKMKKYKELKKEIKHNVKF